MEQAKKTFIEMLPKIYGMYTGGFIAFIILMAILEQMGLGADTIGILFIVCLPWWFMRESAGFRGRCRWKPIMWQGVRSQPCSTGWRRLQIGCPELLLSQWPEGFILAVMDISPFWWVGPEAMFWSLL